MRTLRAAGLEFLHFLPRCGHIRSAVKNASPQPEVPIAFKTGAQSY
jgi:hypothetical protein